MVLDGQFDDWPARAQQPVTGCGTTDHVFLRVAIGGKPVNLQGLDRPRTLLLDWDQNPKTGNEQGHDAAIVFSPANQQGRGVSVGPADAPHASWDTLGLTFAPTTASNQFEVRLPRTLILDGQTHTAGDSIRWTFDNTQGIAQTAPKQPAPPPALATPLPPPANDAMRVVAWNLEFGNVLHQREQVIRLLAAMQPHVVLLQEVESSQRAADLLRVFREAMPNTQWTLRLGPSGGRIRSGIATRLPAWDVPTFEHLSRADSPRSTVRTAALVVQGPDQRRMLCVSAHLKCCGVIGGPEDMKRIGEVQAIRRAMDAAVLDNAVPSFHGVLIGGDLNLVGSTMPLDLLIRGGQAMVGGQGDLIIAKAMQPDGLGSQTWQKPGQDFSPGRLDWLVYGGLGLTAQRALVLDTLDLSADQLAAMQLKPSDTGVASDHLPILVDFTYKAKPAQTPLK